VPPPVEDPNKAAFIERVRKALGRSQPLTAIPDHPSLKTTLPRHTEKIRTIQAKSAARLPISLARLVETATAAAWNVHRATGHSQAAEMVAEIAATIHAKTVIRTAEDLFKRVDVDSTLRKRGVSPTILAVNRQRRRDSLKRIAFGADLGVSAVEYVIAETASCAVVPHRGVARLATLAPSKLVLVIEESQVLETLDDFFALKRFDFMTQRSRMPNYYNFISGPSRTADIEQTLTIGVHGPGEVHMVLIAGA